MTRYQNERKPVAHLRLAFNTLFDNPLILFPFIIIAFLQTFVLEIIFFAPRQPLVRILGPLIVRNHGEVYLHYPYNYMLLSSWFQKAQLPMYIFISCFFIGCAIHLIQRINEDTTASLLDAMNATSRQYFHLVIAAFVGGVSLYGLSRFLITVSSPAWVEAHIATGGMLKQMLSYSLPLLNLLIAVLVTTLFAFVMPIIIIEKRGFFSAIFLNFKHLWGYFWYLLSMMFLSSLLYVPFLLLRYSMQSIEYFMSPEIWGGTILASALVLLFIDAIQITAITTLYLYKRESV